MRRRGAGRGASLLELLVALALLAVVILVSAVLVVELIRASAAEESEPTTGGGTDIALGLIERDVRLALRVRRSARWLGSADAALVLEMSGGDQVAYAVRGDRLDRALLPAGGEEPRERVLVRDVLVAELSGPRDRLVEVVLRRAGEPVRERAVLARNLLREAGRGPPP